MVPAGERSSRSVELGLQIGPTRYSQVLWSSFPGPHPGVVSGLLRDSSGVSFRLAGCDELAKGLLKPERFPGTTQGGVVVDGIVAGLEARLFTSGIAV